MTRREFDISSAEAYRTPCGRFSDVCENGVPATVLIAEDDASSRILMAESLSAVGFQIIEAESGERALDLFVEHKPDVAILDVVMPGMDGFETCRSIRAHVQGQHMPILMVTALEDRDSIQSSYEAGATDFMPKPIDFFSLPYRVRYMVRNKRLAARLRLNQQQLEQAQIIARMGHWNWIRETGEIEWSKSSSQFLPVTERSTVDELRQLLAQLSQDTRNQLSTSILTAVRARRGIQLELKRQAAVDEMQLLQLHAEPVFGTSGRLEAMRGTLQDISAGQESHQQIHTLAYYDHVTGLPNRALLHERLNTALNHSRRLSNKFALLFLDLDKFKIVNDTLGHDAGDELLSQVSDRLSSVVRDVDHVMMSGADHIADDHTIARLGGDEFVILISDIDKVEDVARVAKRIGKTIAETYLVKGSNVNISTTIGISVYPMDGTDSESLLKHADIAMYHAKKRGRNGYQFYSDEIQQLAQERFALEQELRLAIEQSQFRMVYQPKVKAANGVVCGVEALIRWDHPLRGSIPPAEFIALAEETELIIPLGTWILEQACQQMQAWHAQGLTDLHVSVNCSSIQLIQADMHVIMRDILKRSGLQPQFLEIELTESLLLEDPDRGIEILDQLNDIGVMTSIDDFGTGFSSMNYLRKLPVNKLKIDKSFVSEINQYESNGQHDDLSDGAIVSAILTLARYLNLKVVGEGVETKAQFDFLLAHGCDEMQGYLISKPIESADFPGWLEQRKQDLRRKTG